MSGRNDVGVLSSSRRRARRARAATAAFHARLTGQSRKRPAQEAFFCFPVPRRRAREERHDAVHEERQVEEGQPEAWRWRRVALAQVAADAFQRRPPGPAQRGAFVKSWPAEDGHHGVDEEVAEGVAGVVPWHVRPAAGTRLLERRSVRSEASMARRTTDQLDALARVSQCVVRQRWLLGSPRWARACQRWEPNRSDPHGSATRFLAFVTSEYGSLPFLALLACQAS